MKVYLLMVFTRILLLAILDLTSSYPLVSTTVARAGLEWSTQTQLVCVLANCDVIVSDSLGEAVDIKVGVV